MQALDEIKGGCLMIRKPRPKTNFVTIPNTTACDNNLPFDTRGLLLYVMSKPDDWTAWEKDLMNNGGCGRDKVRRMLGDLKKFHYMKPINQRDKKGRFSNVEYDIYGEPQIPNKSPSPENPSTVNPATDNPSHTKERPSTKKEETNSIDSDFDEFWETYPIKKARIKAVKSYKAAIRNGAIHSDIMAGVRLYDEESAKDRIEPKYLKHPAKWLDDGDWMNRKNPKLPTEKKSLNQLAG
jgi:hypothetical protein